MAALRSGAGQPPLLAAESVAPPPTSPAVAAMPEAVPAAMPESEPTAVLDAFKRNDNDSVSARAESAAAEGILAGRNAAAEKKGQRKAVAAEAAVLAIKETDAVFVLAAAGRAEPAASCSA